MNRIANITLIFLCLCLVKLQFAEPASCQDQQKDAERHSKQIDDMEAPVRQVLIHLASAASAGDAAGLASLWSEDGVLIDDSGAETRGRQALQERFSNSLKDRGSSSVELHPEKISFPAANLSMVIGAVSRRTGELDLPTARFSMLLVKHGDAWLISQATETRMETRAADHLRELEWLIGKWQTNKPDNNTTLVVEWGAGRNFIISKCIRINNGVQQLDTQIIGWDPRRSEIVSWHFDHSGGFGYAKWSKQTESWLVDFAGVGANGSSSRATNIFVPKNANEFTWQSTEQTSDGVAIADTEALTMQKVKP